MVRNRGLAGGALVAIMLVISILGIACGGPSSQPAGSPASSGDGAAAPGASGHDYRSIVVQRTKTLEQSMEQISVLLLSPQFRDPDWKAQVDTELSKWSNASTEAQQLTPPDAYRAFHEKYLAGLSDFERAANNLGRAILNQNVSAVADARGRMMMAAKTISDASSSMPKQ
jgi:hypothetical protein